MRRPLVASTASIHLEGSSWSWRNLHELYRFNVGGISQTSHAGFNQTSFHHSMQEKLTGGTRRGIKPLFVQPRCDGGMFP